MRRMRRREFLRASVAAGFGLAAARGRVLGANEDVRVAIVGVGSHVKIGGQGRAEIRVFRGMPGVRVAALCDVDRANLEPEVRKLRDRGDRVAAFIDIRKLLEARGIDAIACATPNHWHALATIWACQAGKDVFVEKPASHNIREGRRMVEAARKYRRIVQSGSGPRSRTGIGEAIAYVREGNLGRVLYAHGINYRPRMSIGKVGGPRPIPSTVDYDLWSGPAPKVPLMREHLHYDWHWDWRTGNGDLGNMGIHYMDGCRWALGRKALPRRVIALGGRLGYVDDGETPNTQIAFLDYDPAPIVFEVRGLPKAKRYRAGPWARNAGETMDTYRGIRIGLVIHCEGGCVVNDEARDRQGRRIRRFAPENEDLRANFIRAVRSRDVAHLQSDILEGHLSAALVHMANISYRIGRTTRPEAMREAFRGETALEDAFARFREHLRANAIDLGETPAVLGPWLAFDPARERFVGPFAERANALLSRPYRKPYVVPETV